MGHRQEAAPRQTGFRDKPQVSHSHWESQESSLEAGSGRRPTDIHTRAGRWKPIQEGCCPGTVTPVYVFYIHPALVHICTHKWAGS